MPFLDSNSTATDNRNAATGSGVIVSSNGKGALTTVALPGSVNLAVGSSLNTGSQTKLSTVGGSINVTTQGLDATTLDKILTAQAKTIGAAIPPSATPEKPPEEKPSLARQILGAIGIEDFTSDANKKKIRWAVAGLAALAVLWVFFRRKG